MMCNSRLLWVDQRYDRTSSPLGCELTSAFCIHLLTNPVILNQTIIDYQPDILCFDFDYPDCAGLELLQQIKRLFPGLPILMMTEERSVDLALWALRTRVWNYYIKPVSAQELVANVDAFMQKTVSVPERDRTNAMPQPMIPEATRLLRNNGKGGTTHAAVEYVNDYFHRKVTLDSVASLCGMSKSHFSRKFKNDNGITFQGYLVQQRIKKASALLMNSNVTVTEVARAVGFTDLSIFTRTFQRYMGICPSRYNNDQRAADEEKPVSR